MSDRDSYKGRIQYDFNTFTASTIQLGKNKGGLSPAQLANAVDAQKGEILRALTSNLSPFSCINPIHDFTVVDSKRRKRRADGSFNFQGKDHVDIAGEKDIHISGYSYVEENFIESLDYLLKKGWRGCQAALNSIIKGLTSVSPQIVQYLKQTNELKILMLGGDLSEKKSVSEKFPIFFAFCFSNQAQKIHALYQSRSDAFYEKPLPLSNYLVFSPGEKPTLFTLNVSVNFQSSKPNYQMYLKKELRQHVDQGQDVLDKNKFSCYLQVADPDKFFLTVLASSQQSLKEGKLFKTFKFYPKGDYIEYPFREPAVRRRKFMKGQSYSLAFQGGGAKGVAYVGAYQAIRELRKEGQNKPIPITSIMGSSAGGIIALAVSTNIEPYEVQKICYKMNAIPASDRIDRRYLRRKLNATNQQLDESKANILKTIKNILAEYGLIQTELIDKLVEFFQKLNKDRLKEFEQRLSEFILAGNQSMGQIFNYKEGDFTELNLLGLLLEGALMQGEAIFDIGSECLVKYVLLNANRFANIGELHNIFPIERAQELSGLVKSFDGLCSGVLSVPFQSLSKGKNNRALISIINRTLTVMNRWVGKSFFLTPKWVNGLNKWFSFIPIYGQAQPPKDTELWELISNHKRLHFASNNISEIDEQQKVRRRQVIEQILNRENRISYLELTQIINQEYLLNPRNFQSKEQSATLLEFISDIFKENKELFADPIILREIAENVVEALQDNSLAENFPTVNAYIQEHNHFKEAVQKITLSEYYGLTKIELTCTSVDLDNQILRFFNHKTTPLLPVCRAVQMTGSFPVGFKAQKWQSSWGKYQVHYPDVCREVNITDHEFTDGGMLANFPIKYFDNDYIRDNYFSHVINKNKNKYQTILLGFGLDKLDPANYHRSETEVYEGRIQKSEVEKANLKLKDAFSALTGFGLFDIIGKVTGLMSSLKAAVPNEIQWKALNHQLLNQVPLFRFLFKLVSSYPRADRNLNLECFTNTIFLTDLQRPESSQSELNIINRIDINSFISQTSYIDVPKQEPKKGFWGGIFGSAEPTKADDTSLKAAVHNVIQSSHNTTIYLKEIPIIYETYRSQYYRQQTAMNDETLLLYKRSIKQKLINVIFLKMKLSLTKEQVEEHTLKFLGLKYPEAILEQQDLHVSNRKFEDHCTRKQYDRVLAELPLPELPGKMWAAELQGNKEQQLKQKQLQNGRKYIVSIGANGRKEYLQINKYLLSERMKYLVQYIFLSKINGQPLQHKAGIQIVNKLNSSELLLHYDLEKQSSYISIRDLKLFYRRLFASGAQVAASRFDPKTLMDKQSLRSYDRDDSPIWRSPALPQPAKKWEQEVPYLDNDNSPQTMQSEGANLLRSFITKIAFRSVISQSFLNQQNAHKIEEELADFVRRAPSVHAAELSKRLKLSYTLGSQYLANIISEEAISGKIVNLLFNTNGQDYSDSPSVSQALQEEYENHTRLQGENLKVADELIEAEKSNNLKAGTTYESNNPMKIQITYLMDLEETLSFQILCSKIQKSPDLVFPTQKADLSTGSFTKTDNQKYREKLRDELTADNAEKAKIRKELKERVRRYHLDYQSFSLSMIQIQFGILNFCGQQDQSLPIITKLKGYSYKLTESMINIKEYLISQLEALIALPSGQVTQERIDKAYSLQYDQFRSLCETLFTSIKLLEDIYLYSLKKKAENKFSSQKKLSNEQFNQDNDKISQDERDMALLKNVECLRSFVVYTCGYLDLKRFQLPNFEYQWQIYMVEYKYGALSKRMQQNLSNQLTIPFLAKWKAATASQPQPELKVHAILEGVDTANVYFPYILELFNRIKEKGKSGLAPYDAHTSASKLTLRAITTSSYHSVFGVLLALGLDDNELKAEMSAIRSLAMTFEQKKLIDGMYDSYQWLKVSPQQYKELWGYLRSQKLDLFRELEKISLKDPNHSNFKEDFQKLRSIYHHEQQKVSKLCQDILSDIAGTFSSLEGQGAARQKALKIAQKYAFNYTCSLNLQHEYQTSNKNSYYLYEKVMKKVFENYGSLLEGLVANVLTAEVRISLKGTDSSHVYKGIMVKQLLAVFRVKDYVQRKLREKWLKENITLLQFFNNAPVQILLNFTTVNIGDARLELMNKNTMPNIPLWAAVVASTSLPFFYREFECSTQWQNPVFDRASLFQRIVNDFFRSVPKSGDTVSYMSGNILSSLPMELLTNETTLAKMFIFDRDHPNEPYIHLGVAFNTHTHDYCSPTFLLKRKYLDYGYMQGIKDWWGLPKDSQYKRNCNQVETHKITPYDPESGLMGKISKIMGQGESMKLLGIFVDSNDNFVLHAYWNKLVRLPIKIDTLDFHEIINKSMKNDYGVDIPSEKTKQTIERSYHITKYFSMENFINSSDNHSRYLINFRVQLLPEQGHIPGVKSLFAFVQLLSHSKWNRNKFNNFMVDYAFQADGFDQCAKRADNSEILWQLNVSSKLYLRFYFPEYSEKESFVLFTQFSIDVSELVSEMPLINSYDYQFSFGEFVEGQDECHHFEKVYLGPVRPLAPLAKNQLPLNENNKDARLLLRRWRAKNEKKQTEFYVKALNPKNI